MEAYRSHFSPSSMNVSKGPGPNSKMCYLLIGASFTSNPFSLLLTPFFSLFLGHSKSNMFWASSVCYALGIQWWSKLTWPFSLRRQQLLPNSIYAPVFVIKAECVLLFFLQELAYIKIGNKWGIHTFLLSKCNFPWICSWRDDSVFWKNLPWNYQPVSLERK